MHARTWLLAFSASTLLLGCGGGGSGDDVDARPPFDASGPPDAAPRVYCVDKIDSECGYSPEPVLPSEVSLDDQLTLAERFKPAQIFTGDDVWSISLHYMVNEGGGLMRAPCRQAGNCRLNFSYDVDPDTDTWVAVDPAPNMLTEDYTDLPTDNGSGLGYVYFIDGPGTGTGPGIDDETWSAAWRSIQGYATAGGGDPAEATYPPLQYAHLFWLDKELELLAIQYWFYYPYDKFQNNHEGDWEHMNVVLDYREPSGPVIALAQFSSHGGEWAAVADNLYRIGDRDGGDGDHVVVFVGGATCMTYDSGEWCGDTSGASYAYPGVYDRGYIETVAGGATLTGRAIHADDIEVRLLPRSEDIDFSVDPDLSWYVLPFLFGEPIIAANDPVIQATYNDRAPVAPSPQHDEYDVGIEEVAWQIDVYGIPEPMVVPDGWTLINQPPSSVFE